MAANTAPIYSLAPVVAWAQNLATANTATDGTGTVSTIFTADAEGGRIERVRVKPLGTNVATVLRLFINNGSTNATAANNTLIAEQTIAAATASAVAALAEYEIQLNLALPAGYKINATVGTTIAAGISVTGIGGKY